MRRKWLWVVLLVILATVAPAASAEELATIAGTSLGFQPILDLTETQEFPGYASEANQLYVMAVEVPKTNTLKTLDDFEKLLAANETAPELTIVSKQRNIVEGINSHLVQYSIKQQDLEIAQWVFVLEGEKKFGQIVISTMQTFAEEHKEELMTMLKSFRWVDQVKPVLTYTLTLPEGWVLDEGDEELAVYAPQSEGEPDPNAPFIFVMNFKSPVEEEYREGFIQDFFMHEETKKLIGTEELTIDSNQAILYFIEDTKEDGKKVVNLICIIYAEKTAYGIMTTQSEVVTPEFFKTVIQSWKLVK